jgi:hypothetical protein
LPKTLSYQVFLDNIDENYVSLVETSFAILIL